jgi:hypothetical protein
MKPPGEVRLGPSGECALPLTGLGEGADLANHGGTESSTSVITCPVSAAGSCSSLVWLAV